MLAKSSKWIEVGEAVSLATQIGKEINSRITPKEERMLSLVAESCPVIDLDGRSLVKIDDLSAFVGNLKKAIKNSDSSFLLQKRGLRVPRIVDVQEFCESKEYMGQKGYIRPKVLEGMIKLFDNPNYIECVLTGAIGWGKSYFSELSMDYMLYKLSCFHNPQAEYDLAPGSSIVFIQQSRSFNLARKVIFTQFCERLKESPYFRTQFPFDPNVKAELRFPKNISVMPVGGTDTAALGMNVFGGIIDEMNFMSRTVDSAKTQFTGEEEYDQAERLYNTLIRRMKSRFQQKGKLPGVLLLVSSVNYPNDFTSRKIAEAKTDPTILPLSYSQWEVLPPEKFCEEKFLVEVGNEFKQSRIIRDRIEALDASDVIEIPIDYRAEFERDIEAALRDLAGVTTGTRHPFIPYREEIVKATQEFGTATGSETRQIFTTAECVITNVLDPVSPDFDKIIDLGYIEECIADPSTVFAAHIDVAVSDDCCGVGVGRIVGYRLLPVSKFWSDRIQEFVEVRDIRAPIYQMDGVLRLIPPSGGGEIDLGLVRDMLLYLRGIINLRWITCDSYQSTMLIQAFRKSRIRSGVLSVDASIAPYSEVKMAIKDGRIKFPRHAALMRELREIEKDQEKDKVDHPAGGSKDVSDAVAGAVFMLQTKEASYGRPASAPRSQQVSERRLVRTIRMGRR